MTIKIDDDVPLPEDCWCKRNKYASTIQGMKPGQSFLMEEKDKGECFRIRNNITSSLKSIGLKGIKIATRWTDEGMRIWRVK